MSYFTEENIRELMDRYRSFGPLPGILLTFMKSFVPPLPTMLIVGINAAVYGMWLGFLYSWIGIVGGCMTTFLIVRKMAEIPFMQKWLRKPKIQRSMNWIRTRGFSYVFLLSLFPVGPFVIVNMAAAAARMQVRSYLIAVVFGKAVMVMSVSYIGHDFYEFIRHPYKLVYVALFVGLSLWASRTIEGYFAKTSGERRNRNLT
ncbi:TVP38/TMEM64 family protein [Paenibacillus caui]|uniref:TVP38/TMEM64 family protein n=1 Tax=Paenibacillus caui TaxID=2873927 RepID=UPI001CA9F21C|nr:TVP38/TMEM64 family protein [Paenibacillus caui]